VCSFASATALSFGRHYRITLLNAFGVQGREEESLWAHSAARTEARPHHITDSSS
jgi:hypothetical protein